MFTQALTTDRSVLDRAAMAADLFSLGEVYQTRGDLASAWDNYVRAFDVYAGMGKKTSVNQVPETAPGSQPGGPDGPLPGTLRKARHPHPQPFLIFSETRQHCPVRKCISFPRCTWERDEYLEIPPQKVNFVMQIISTPD